METTYSRGSSFCAVNDACWCFYSYLVLNVFLILQEPEDLFETISQAMLNAVDRDAVSGMGVVVHVM